MTQQHPIVPPSKLLQLWGSQHYGCNKGFNELLIEAARWGADEELEACIDWISVWHGLEHPELLIELLRAARRPKPPSLKEQALAVLDDASNRLDAVHENTIRRALEQLDD